MAQENVWYMNGAGNDFVVMDVRGLDLDLRDMAVQLCRRVGADGFLGLDEATDAGVAAGADFRLHFYNADGLRGEMCGNGARCICRFAYDCGIAGENMAVETDAGLVYGWRLAKDWYRVKLNLPSVLDLERRSDAVYLELGCPGLPHSVTEVSDSFHDKEEMADSSPTLAAILAGEELGLRASESGHKLWQQREKLRPLALELRHDTAFPKGVNVNLYRLIGPAAVELLTFERGVEDYTLACGTGSASVAIALWAQGQLPGGRLAVHNPGGELAVTLEFAPEVSDEAAGAAPEFSGTLAAVYLEGPVEIGTVCGAALTNER